MRLKSMLTRHGFLVPLAVVLCSIAGCGGSASKATSNGGPTAGGLGSKLSLRADPSGQLRFNKKTLEAKAGDVTIVMKNPAPLSHNVSIEGSGVNEMGETVGQGGTSTVSANLKPGRYTFYCSVPGHREGGMVGTLTVTR
jgi:plastocyanin